ncbi:MAG: serine/threonine protein kinase [Pseudomonadota bacterium]|nr:serine/threonine protein kinase [Pseudomonadota bacterium]
MSETSALIGRTLHGTLLIRALIGEGAMGAVFLAEHRNLPDKRFAIKVLLNAITSRPIFQERFNEEARHQASLDHPNIVKVHDFFREDGQYFLVMDYVDGEPLSALIERSGAMDERAALALMDGILLGLDHAHRQGIVHRDVKPSNILVDRDMRPRLTDFGIAIRAGETRLTATGAAAVGTSAYMSPEQIRTPGQIDQRADVYAAGVVLFEMLTGTVPFDGDSDFAIHEQHIKARVPDPRSINPLLTRRVSSILLHALAKDPAHRFQGCEDFRRCLSGERAPPVRWQPWAARAAGVLAVLALLLAWPSLTRVLQPSGHDGHSGQLPDGGTRPLPPQQRDLQAEQASARSLVLSSVQLLEILCQQSAEITRKRAGQHLAEQIPDTARAEAFGRQVQELQHNVTRLLEQYGSALQALSQLDPSLRQAALGQTSPDPTRQPFVHVLDETLHTHVRPSPPDPGQLPRLCSRAGIASTE